MFYHLIVKTSETTKVFFEFDLLSSESIINDTIIPYLENRKILVDGCILKHDEIKQIKVKRSKLKAHQLEVIIEEGTPDAHLLITAEEVIQERCNSRIEDVTRKLFRVAQTKFKSSIHNHQNQSMARQLDKKKVFIVHGHDDLIKTKTARFIEKIGLEAIILHEQASSGRTIIENIEHYTNVGFGIVLYTPCDVGAAKDKEDSLNQRSRQNVVLEHGFLMGKLGRNNICALVQEGIEKPSDISGIVYIDLDESGAWQYRLIKEMKESGYEIDANEI